MKQLPPGYSRAGLMIFFTCIALPFAFFGFVYLLAFLLGSFGIVSFGP
jgi:hypothetical protein